MIRPEAQAFLLRWAEAAFALGGTAFALWVVGAPSLSFGWASAVLSVPILIAGGVWLRASIRRARAPSEDQQLGRIFVEERRVLYIGVLSNVQFSLEDVERIELAKGGRGERGLVRFGSAPNALIFHFGDAPPVSVSLRAEGTERLIDALSGLPRFSAERLAAERARRAERSRLMTIWNRADS